MSSRKDGIINATMINSYTIVEMEKNQEKFQTCSLTLSGRASSAC